MGRRNMMAHYTLRNRGVNKMPHINNDIHDMSRLKKKQQSTLKTYGITFMAIGIIMLAYDLISGQYHYAKLCIYIIGIVAGIGTLQRKLYGWYAALILCVSIIAHLAVSVITDNGVNANTARSLGSAGEIIPIIAALIVPIAFLIYFIKRRSLYSK